ncbi:hypothetical protein J1N35_012023 [Gossypium stocksii]|uniref:Uncharacterized protein n=1 Tax=Gossypium stocksii TaxID=47602 RepID=A0A9D4ADW8_9ROSI|nr:hypothetical protein J1N35_012023 [Gossypium stocksii]
MDGGMVVARTKEALMLDKLSYRGQGNNSTPVMCEAMGFAEGILWCSSIEVMKDIMEEWAKESRNWNSIKILLSGIAGSKSQCSKHRAL